MKTRTTRSSLLFSIISLVICCAMLLGTTYAWFTDSVTTGKNKIVAGSLDVELYTKVGDDYVAVDENTSLFDENALWEPGYTQTVYLKVKNAGTLALKYKLAVNVIAEQAGINMFDESFELSDNLVFGRALGDTETIYATREEAWAAVGDTKGIGSYARSGNLAAAAEEFITLVVYMPTTVGNEANYKTGTTPPSIELGVTLVATQDTVEADSYDNQYDDGAELPILVSSVAEVQRAIAAATATEVVKLSATDDIDLGQDNLICINSSVQTKSLDFDGEGHTITVSDNGVPFFGENFNTITIRNVTIKGDAAYAVSRNFYGNLIMENVTIDLTTVSGSNTAYPVLLNGTGNVVMNNCTVKGMEGSSMISYAPYTVAHIFVGASTNLIINGGNIGSIFVNSNPAGPYGTVTVNSGTVSKIILETEKNGTANTFTSAKLIQNGGTVTQVIENPQNLDLTGCTQTNP